MLAFPTSVIALKTPCYRQVVTSEGAAPVEPSVEVVSLPEPESEQFYSA